MAYPMGYIVRVSPANGALLNIVMGLSGQMRILSAISGR